MRLLENESKARLARGGVTVPSGGLADSPDAARLAAVTLGGEVFVKALVPENRRSRNRGVVGPVGADEAAAAARDLLGARILGHRCRSVYVEESVSIVEELYLGFSWGSEGPRAVASAAGGVGIEESSHGSAGLALTEPGSLVLGEAEELWRRALAVDTIPPGLRDLTVAASAVFADDALSTLR